MLLLSTLGFCQPYMRQRCPDPSDFIAVGQRWATSRDGAAASYLVRGRSVHELTATRLRLMGATKDPGKPGHTSGKLACFATGAVGTHAGLWLANSSLAVTVLALAAGLAMLVFLTGLFAPEKYSDRAFRMLTFASRQTTAGRGRSPESEGNGIQSGERLNRRRNSVNGTGR